MPAEPQLRRVRQSAPGGEGGLGSSGSRGWGGERAAGRRASDRVLPGMPLAFGDPEEDDPAASRPRFRYDEPRGPWWKPKSKAGRVFLGFGVVLVLGSFTAAGVAMKTYLSRDARFRIAGTENIQATGLSEVSRAEMLPVFGEDVGRNIFFVPLNARRKELEQLPWVEHATVMRLLPDQIRVSIVERQPVAFTRNGNQIGLVDGNGVLLTMSPAAMARHHYSFPVLTGIDPGDPAEARKARLSVYLRLMAELDSTGHRYSQQISEIDLTDPEDARVLMPEQGRDILAHFGEDDFLERFERYRAHIAEWRQQYPNLASVDLRYDQQVVLEMAGGKQMADTAAGNSSGNAAGGDVKPEAGQAAETAAATTPKPKTPKAAAHAKAGNAAAKKKAMLEKKREQARRTALNERHKNAGKTNARTNLSHSTRSAALSQGG